MLDERLSVEELRQWIADGVSEEKAQSESFLNSREAAALQMPGFEDQLSPAEIDDLGAYLALMQYRVSVSDDPSSSRGEQLARKYACFSCHGELGQGGVANPGSLKGYIPGFFGTDFRALTRNGNRQDLHEWIENGVSDFFMNQGFAGFYPGQFFNDRQAIKMPAYKDLLTEAEISLLVDYLLELLEAGPLTADALLEYRPVGTSAPVVPDRNSSATDHSESAAGKDPLFDEVSRTLENSCIKCHGPEKQRSSYRLDYFEAALKGGEIAEFVEQAAIVPGDSSQGLFMRFIEAEEEDPMEEIYPMPPGDNPKLSPGQIDILKRWIDAGAPWPAGRTLDLKEVPE
jgi:mono/diheme cytochrome c family protein